MEKQTPQVEPNIFYRDIILGDVGDDVAKTQEILNFFGFAIDAEEVNAKRYGKSSEEAAKKLREQMASDPFMAMLGSFILKYVFGIDPEELNPEYARGDAKTIRQYREDDFVQLTALEAGTFGSRGASRAAELATRYVGQREHGDNQGAAVRLFNDGKEGLPWCGGFVNYIMDHTVGKKLFDQPDFLRARSFEDEAKQHGAFRVGRGNYDPKVGDVVVFTRGNGGGHVGIVSDVAADGTVTYVSGNDAEAVRARTFKKDNPPKSLIGYADTHALARAKGIDMGSQEQVMNPANLRVAASRHSDAAVRGG